MKFLPSLPSGFLHPFFNKDLVTFYDSAIFLGLYIKSSEDEGFCNVCSSFFSHLSL